MVIREGEPWYLREVVTESVCVGWETEEGVKCVCEEGGREWVWEEEENM